MRVLITAQGEHEPPAHYMAVDNHGFLIDLRNVKGTLADPAIVRVEWGPQVLGVEPRDGGTITRRDGTKQPFWEFEPLKPYLEAWRARRDELLPAKT